MRKIHILTLLLPAVALVAAAPAHARSFVINPQGGVVGSNFSSDAADLDGQARLGYALGGQVRFGGRGYIAPGIFWQHTSLEATVVDDATLDEVTDDLEVSSLMIPVHLGYNLGGGMGAGSFSFRVYGGPSLTMVTQVKDNAFLITKDDYEDTILGAQVGVGFDLSTLTIDANYEFGLSNVFKADEDTKQNAARATVGLKF
jgi:hypothetical protein